MTHTRKQIEYFVARSYFEDAEQRGLKLQQGHIDTSIWLHKEGINLDTVLETAKNFNDAKTFIIADGINKGFYIYSTSQKACIKLVNQTSIYTHAESA